MKSLLTAHAQNNRIPIRILLKGKEGVTEEYTLYAKYGENLLDLISRNFEVTLKSNEIGTWITSISGKNVKICEDAKGGIQGYINNSLPYVITRSSPFFLGLQNIAVTNEFELRMQYDPFLEDIRIPFMLKVKLLIESVVHSYQNKDNHHYISCTAPVDKSMRDCLSATFFSHEIMHFYVEPIDNKGIIIASLCCKAASPLSLPQAQSLSGNKECLCKKKNAIQESYTHNTSILEYGGMNDFSKNECFRNIPQKMYKCPPRDPSKEKTLLSTGNISTNKENHFTLKKENKECVGHKEKSIILPKKNSDTKNNIIALPENNDIKKDALHTINSHKNADDYTKTLATIQKKNEHLQEQKNGIQSLAVMAFSLESIGNSKTIANIPINKELINRASFSVVPKQSSRNFNLDYSKNTIVKNYRNAAKMLNLLRMRFVELNCKSSTLLSKCNSKMPAPLKTLTKLNTQKTNCNLTKNNSHLAKIIFAFDDAKKRRQKAIARYGLSRYHWVVRVLKNLLLVFAKKH